MAGIKPLESILQRYRQADIRTKINIYYLSVMMISILAVLLVFNSMSSSYLEQKVEVSAQQTSQALEQNISSAAHNVSQCSDYIYFDDSIQTALRRSRTEGIDPAIQSTINKRLMDMILLNSYISSVYLFDNYNNVYGTSKQNVAPVVNEDVKRAPWYASVEASGGSPVWVTDDGSVVGKTDTDLPVSLVRVVYDVETYKQSGILMIHLNRDFLHDVLQKLNSKDASQFFIIDDKGRYITESADCRKKETDGFLSLSARQPDVCLTGRLGGGKVVFSSTKSKTLNWRIIGILPLSGVFGQAEGTGTMMLTVVLLDMVLFLLGQKYLASLIAKPLTRMGRYMKNVQNGRFEPMPVETDRDDEVVRLKKVFNIMVDRIQNLLLVEKEEQTRLRLSELNMLRAQINPHFLYNTLDAVSALTLTKDCSGAYTLTRALENFYRISLSSGRDVITVGDEIRCIGDYVTIMNIRYDGTFTMQCRVSEEIMDCRILKLILQPFVENSILHGVHNRHGEGKIILSGARKGETLEFRVEDNGAGIPAERLEEIMGRTETAATRGSFGIRSSVTRISLFYGVDSPVSIRSEVNRGTAVTVRVPIIGREENDGANQSGDCGRRASGADADPL